MPVHLVPATTQHRQFGLLNALPQVAVAAEVQARLGEDHAGSVPRPAAGVTAH